MSITTHKCLNEAVGRREVIQSLENLRKKTGGPTERHADTYSKYENPSYINFSCNLELKSFSTLPYFT